MLVEIFISSSLANYTLLLLLLLGGWEVGSGGVLIELTANKSFPPADREFSLIVRSYPVRLCDRNVEV